MSVRDTPRLPDSGMPGPRAGTLFTGVAIVFGLIFAGFVAWLELDQSVLQATTARLQDEALPYAVERQRLARNLEVLRLEGERVMAGRTPQARQQALFVVALMASHPSLLEDPAVRRLSQETETFLNRMARNGSVDADSLAEWKRISQRISLLADDISVDGISRADTDVRQMAAVTQQARYKLRAVLVLVLIFLAGLLILIRRAFIRPLQQIDADLAAIDDPEEPPPSQPKNLHEIRAIESAIGQLRTVMREKDEARRELEALAATDMLTGLNNRRNFMHLAEAEFGRAQRYGRPIAVALADLDHFKRINDRYGHNGGDIALIAFADLVRDTLRTTDIACRYGGEEFAFVFPETTPQEALVLTERMRSALEARSVPLPDGRLIHFTMSVGIADGVGCALEVALRHADDALYVAKEAGRNRSRLAAPKPDGSVAHKA